MRLRNIWTLIRESFEEFFKNNAMRNSAAIAYYAMLSLAPLLVIAVGIAGLIFGEETAREQALEQVRVNVGPGAANMLREAIRRTQPRDSVWAIIVGGVLLMVGASGVFSQLQSAMNEV